MSSTTAPPVPHARFRSAARLINYFSFNYENRLLRDQDFNDDKKDAGDIGAGHSVTALYELVPAGQAIESAPIDPLKYQQRPVLSSASKNAEAMTVKIRYKQPDSDTSSLISIATPDENRESADLGFAAAVVEFGMLLRDSDFKGSSSFAVARSLAETHKGRDEYGHRAEFIRLIGAAEGVVRLTGSRAADRSRRQAGSLGTR